MSCENSFSDSGANGNYDGKPNIISIKSLSQGQIEIQYDKQLSKKSVENSLSNHYEINDTSKNKIYPFAAKLKADYKTVILFVNGLKNNSKYEIYISYIKDVSEVYELNYYYDSFVVADSSVPTLSVEILSHDRIKVNFSEAVNILNNNFILLDDVLLPVTGVTYPVDNDYTKALIKTSKNISFGDHKISVPSGNILDYAGYNTLEYSDTVNLSPNAYNTSSVLFVTVMDFHRVRFVFSNPVVAGVGNFSYSLNSEGSNLVSAKDVMNLNDKTFDVYFDEIVFGVSLYFRVNNVKDFYSNSIYPNPTVFEVKN